MSDDDEHLPDVFKNTNHATVEVDLPTIKVTSFGHRRGPLVPAPDLSFDCRKLPNPPKNVRTGHTGLSKTLRDAFLSKAEVQRRFQEICALIDARVQQAQLTGEQSISVGVFCELGKHRSVSIVEQLGQTRFPGWDVVVNHRDVHIGRSNQNSRAGRGHRVQVEDAPNDDTL